MRFLSERPDHDGKSSAGQKSAPDRCADPRDHGKNAVPLHDILSCPTCDQACGKGDSEPRLEQGGRSMSGANVSPTGRNNQVMSGANVKMNIPKHIEEVFDNLNISTSRRNFLKSSGLLVVSVGAAPLMAAAGTETGEAFQGAGPYPDPDYHQLDSWIVIHEDNTATFYVGKTDMGQGTGTAFRQLMADELDMPFEKTTCIMGITDVTVDQGGSGGSNAIQVSAWPMRRVAAEARRVLLEMASKKFETPVDQLTVSDGVITAKADPSKKVSYGELIGGKRFNVTLTSSNNVIDNTTGVAKVKTD